METKGQSPKAAQKTPGDPKLCFTYDAHGRPVNGLSRTPGRRIIQHQFEQAKSIEATATHGTGKAHLSPPKSSEYVPDLSPETLHRLQRFGARFEQESRRALRVEAPSTRKKIPERPCLASSSPDRSESSRTRGDLIREKSVPHFCHESHIFLIGCGYCSRLLTGRRKVTNARSKPGK